MTTTQATRLENDGYGDYEVPLGTDGMTEFERSTLGTWADRTGRRLVARYLDEGHVRVDRSDKSSDVYTTREWMVVYDNIRDAGFVRQ